MFLSSMLKFLHLQIKVALFVLMVDGALLIFSDIKGHVLEWISILFRLFFFNFTSNN